MEGAVVDDDSVRVSAPSEKRASLIEFDRTNRPIKIVMRKAGMAMGKGLVIRIREAQCSVGGGDQVPRTQHRSPSTIAGGFQLARKGSGEGRVPLCSWRSIRGDRT